MAWVDYQRIVEGTSISGKLGESLRIPEKWQIRVDSPLTSKTEILAGVTGQIGVTYGSPHWDLPALKAMEFELSPLGRDGMRWTLSVVYYVPPAEKVLKENGIPEDVWERGGGVTTVPAFQDKDGQTIVNAAGDALEGLEREREEKSWTLVRCYESDAELESDVEAAAGKVNSDEWDDKDPKTWKCYFKGAKRVTTTKIDGDDDGGTLEYIESQWEFRYDPLTWKLMPWDIGFMELDETGKKRAITTDDGKPVKQPVGLDTDGKKLPNGTKPLVINNGEGAEVYESAAFGDVFGAPHLLPGA